MTQTVNEAVGWTRHQSFDTRDTMPENIGFETIAAYQFFCIENPRALRVPLRDFCRSIGLRGTILLSHEGVNLFLSGASKDLFTLQTHLEQELKFPPFAYKRHAVQSHCFSRMLVKFKKEIITMGIPDVDPSELTGDYLDPQEFAHWMSENREMLILDTRNDYEVELGKFQSAVDLGIKSFRDFPVKATALSEKWKDQPVVMYCTGGIRCEKASHYMMKKLGFRKVYQLRGGILNYFKECGTKNFNGECFVFDHRVALEGSDGGTETRNCYVCKAELDFEEMQSSNYIPFKMCPRCDPSSLPKSPAISQG